MELMHYPKDYLAAAAQVTGVPADLIGSALKPKRLAPVRCAIVALMTTDGFTAPQIGRLLDRAPNTIHDLRRDTKKRKWPEHIIIASDVRILLILRADRRARITTAIDAAIAAAVGQIRGLEKRLLADLDELERDQ